MLHAVEQTAGALLANADIVAVRLADQFKMLLHLARPIFRVGPLPPLLEQERDTQVLALVPKCPEPIGMRRARLRHHVGHGTPDRAQDATGLGREGLASYWERYPAGNDIRHIL
jgi:hypothetical protein